MTIYFDNCATTPLSKEAAGAMNEALVQYGNPSSLHKMGFEAEKLVSEARQRILSALGIRPITKMTEKCLIFTGSGTEADNLALFGVAAAKNYPVGKKIIVSDSEHPAVLESAASLERRGFNIVRIPTVGGIPDYDMISRTADKDTVLVSFMLVNNETGAVYDIKRISDIVKGKNPDVIVHSDCVQAFMNIKFTPKSIGADMVSISAHKIGGPKGVGALYVTPEVLKRKQLMPLIMGGGQESGMRSGTENVLGIVGFGAAVVGGMKNMDEGIKRKEELRLRIASELCNKDKFHGVKLNIPEIHSPHVLSITLPDIKSETMLHALSREGIFVSSGSACSSNSGHKSHVLSAFGLTDRERDCTIRVSFSEANTIEQADTFLQTLEKLIGGLVRIG